MAMRLLAPLRNPPFAALIGALTLVELGAHVGNFALVWVQSKGLGMPAYTVWTVRASEAHPRTRLVAGDGHIATRGHFRRATVATHERGRDDEVQVEGPHAARLSRCC